MSRYFFSWLLLCVGLLYECSLYSAQEPDVASAMQKGCELVPRKRSPLGVQASLYDEDEILEDIRYLFQPLQQAHKIPAQIPSYYPIVLRHKFYDYEVSMHLGHIAQSDGTAVVNTYTPGRHLPAACLELYQKAGNSFVRELRKSYIANPLFFTALENCPGNSCVITSVGNLAFDMMILMYMPQAVKPKQRSRVVALINEGVMGIISKQLYDILQKYNVNKANIVLPALGQDAFFEGYDRSEMAKNLIYTAVRTLRFLYGMRKTRLQAISFVTDTPEAYQHYAEALNSVRDSEKEYFNFVEE